MRIWTVQEDLILLELIGDGIETACRELGRPATAIEMRLELLKDYEIVTGPDGEVTHKRLCTTGATETNPSPKIYESGEGRKLMEETIGK